MPSIKHHRANAARTAAWPADDTDILQSLGTAQRRWIRERDAQREASLQDAFTQISRGLAPLLALHGELLEQRLRNATECDSPHSAPAIGLATLQAYAETRYVIDLPAPAAGASSRPARKQVLALRIGVRNAALARLHAAHGTDTSIVVTAWNPLGELQSSEANEAANEALLEWLQAHGFAALTGRGIGKDPAWEPEASFLVPGGGLDLARAVCVRFRQNAVVHSGQDAVPAVVLHPHARVA